MKKMFILMGTAIACLPLAAIVACNEKEDEKIDLTGLDNKSVIKKIDDYIKKQQPGKTAKVKFINGDKNFTMDLKFISKHKATSIDKGYKLTENLKSIGIDLGNHNDEEQKVDKTFDLTNVDFDSVADKIDDYVWKQQVGKIAKVKFINGDKSFTIDLKFISEDYKTYMDKATSEKLAKKLESIGFKIPKIHHEEKHKVD